MSAALDLFTRWKAAKGFPSDRQAALALGTTAQTVQQWKDGKSAGANFIEKMAKDLGESPAMWAALAMKDQTKGEASRAWARIARQLGAAAALALCALGFGGIAAPSKAYAAEFSPMYIMLLRNWPWDWLPGQRPAPNALRPYSIARLIDDDLDQIARRQRRHTEHLSRS